jgi:hypothetical protein
MRRVAALCALVMVASNALAAMGLCVAKTRTVAPVSAGEATEEALCPQHGTDAGGALTGEPVATKHCPQDDPGAQVRSGDLPAATLMPAIDNRLRITVPDPAAGLCSNSSPDDSPQTPLYERLSRLLL